MASFRRILLLRLLLLSVPIILLGVSTTYFVTYRKARSGLLETARQNLTESAVRRGKEIDDSIAALKSNLVVASHHPVLRNRDGQKYSEFLERLSQQLPTQIECLQLIDAITQESLADTCDREIAESLVRITWPQQQKSLLPSPSTVKIQPIFPENASDAGKICKKREVVSNANQLKLLAGVPIYNEAEELNAILVARSVILEPNTVEPGSLTGSTAILARDGTILAHPCWEKVGLKIGEDLKGDSGRLQGALKKAQAGEQNFIHLFSFEQKGVELLAGYAGIPNPISENDEDIWVVLSMTPLNNALAALEEIQQVLLSLLSGLTFVFIAGTILAILYVSREIATPLEELIESIHKYDPLQSQDPIPDDFKVYEFRQLARAFNGAFEEVRSAYKLMDRTLKNAIKTATDLKEAKKKIKEALEEKTLANNRLKTILMLIYDGFGNDLNGLINTLQLLQEDLDDGEFEIGEAKEDIELSLQLTQSLYKNWRKISTMISSRNNNLSFSVEIQEVNLNNILYNISDKYETIIENKGLDFSFQGVTNEEIIIYADPKKLQEILTTLIDNAIYYTNNGNIMLEIHPENVDLFTQQMEKNDDSSDEDLYSVEQKICITIQDTGCGMSPGLIENLNNPWYTRMTKGLSLVIARILMEIMGGTIIFSSDGQDRGTTVRLFLPIVENDV